MRWLKLLIDFTEKLKIVNIIGEEVNVLCPFHEETNPSFYLNTQTGKWYCFGCGRGGGFSSLLQLLFGLSMLSADVETRKWKFEPLEKSNTPVNLEELPENNAVSTYLGSRNISPKTVEEFDIRVNCETRSVIIPVHDGKKLVGWVERRIDREPKYKNSKGLPRSKILFNAERVKKVNSPWVVVVESLFDCIYLHQAGMPVVSTLGSQVSDEQMKKLDKFDYVLVVPHRDEAGEKMVKDLIKGLGSKCESVNLTFWKVKDANELNVVQIVELATKILEIKEDYFNESRR